VTGLLLAKSGGNLLFSWTPPGGPGLVDQYEIVRDTAPEGPFPTSVATVADTASGAALELAAEPAPAFYKVRAVKSGCAGPAD
jgi:hypothetical protein